MTYATDLDRLPPLARRLAGLVPGIYLTRDANDPDRPLLRLLKALAASLEELQEAADQLYQDHFIETASDEALPLLAGLVGATLLREDAPANRAVIARHVHWLRRKGTVRTLEDVVSTASGWSAEVEEAYRSLLVTQDLRSLTPHRGRTTVTWDPVAAADPLSRRAPRGMGPRDAQDDDLLERLPGESLAATLRRLGRSDAGRVPIAPRSLDFGGWAQPHIALVRTSRLRDARIEAREAGTLRPGADVVERGTMRLIPHATRADIAFAGLTLDPAGDMERTVWSAPVEDDYAAAQLTAAHGPAPGMPPKRTATRLLTPTALAAEGDAAETGGALTLTVDGVELIGPPDPTASAEAGQGGPLPFAPVIGDAVLRFADGRRPSPGDRWTLRLLALDSPGTVATTVAGNVPLGGIGDENAATLETTATRGAPAVPIEGPAARIGRAGAVAALRVTRQALDIGYRRAADGAWTMPALGASEGSRLTPVVALADGGPLRIVRLEGRPPDRIGIALLTPDGAPGWSFAEIDLAGLAPGDRPDLDAPQDGPHMALVATADGAILLIGTDEAETGVGVWRVDDPTGVPAITRLDTAPQTRPEPRLAASALLQGGTVTIYGGVTEADRVLSDLWSTPLVGADAGVWRRRLARLPSEGREDAPRVGGALLETPAGPVLIGGASAPGTLSTMVMRADLGGARPRWLRLPDLPVESGPGVLWAHPTAEGLDALVWADRTWPRLMRYVAAEERWIVGASEDQHGAPNPPADGDALFVGDAFLVTGPPPLPPSEVVASAGETARIAFLPAIDLTAADDMRVYEMTATGDTTRWYPPGDLARPSLRLGAGRAARVDVREAPAARVGAVERLGWRPLALRQRSLGPWDDPLALTLDDAIGFDPRLGRIAIRAELAPGRATVAHRIARADAVGPGFGAPGTALPAIWLEPPSDDYPDPFAPSDPPGTLLVERVSPLLAGEPTPEGGAYFADLEMAVSDGDRQVIVEGSPRLAPAWLPLLEDSRTAIGTGSAAQVAFVRADEDRVALSLRERMSAGGDPLAGPHVWLSQVALEGAVEAHLSSGRLDLRYCRLGRPGAPGLQVVGAGLQSRLTLRSVPNATLTIFLYGCVIGTIQVPPWVQVVAAGCTFDAVNRGTPAIEAAGARIRLRHCSIRGETRAGILEASSCVFGGVVATDQPRSGWLRYCVVTPGGRPPLLFKCAERVPSFAGGEPGTPLYLSLDVNNGDALLSAGETARTPGAHADRAARLLEATARTADFLPMGLEAMHLDRTRIADLSMNRRSS